VPLTRLFPIGYDLFKALVALVLLLLLLWLRPQTAPPTPSVAVDPSGAVTLTGQAPSRRMVLVAIENEDGPVLSQRVGSDDGGRWMTAVQLEPGRYTVTAALGSAVSETVAFTVPQPAQLAPLVLDPVPSPASNPLVLSGSAEPGEVLQIFVDGQRVPAQPAIVAGPDGRWVFHLEAPPGGHTFTVAYAASPERVSDPLTLELRAPEPARTQTGVAQETGREANPPPVTAAGRPYVVQEGDWLSKLAADFLGDPARYREIREATNARADADASYATIEDDHLIYPGEKIWIPAP